MSEGIDEDSSWLHPASELLELVEGARITQLVPAALIHDDAIRYLGRDVVSPSENLQHLRGSIKNPSLVNLSLEDEGREWRHELVAGGLRATPRACKREGEGED